MKNSKLVKIVLIVIMSFVVIIATKNSYAATSLTDGTLTGTTTSNNTAGTGTTTLDNSLGTGITTSGNSVGTGTSTLGTTTGTSNNKNNVVLTTNNTSNYNNTSLPKTGVENSMPVVILAVVLGISAVYAYKKMQDYKNI